MSLELVASSNQYAEIASALVGASPHTIFCWGKTASTGGSKTLVAIATSGSANHLIQIDKAAADIIRYRFRDTGSSDALTGDAMSVGTWYAICGRSNSATARKVWLDSDSGTNTTSRTPSGMNRTSVGRSAESSGTDYWDGKIAYVTIWDVALSDTDVAALVAGAYPTTIDPTNIVAHYPFASGSLGVDVVNGNDLTVTGGVYSSDEPSIDPPPSSGVTGTISGTLEDAISSASGNLKASGPVSGALEDATAAGSGNLKASGGVSVSLEGAGALASGSLKASGAVSATLDDAAIAASSTVKASGAIAATLEDSTASAAGNLVASGGVSATLEDASIVSSGDVGDAGVSGSASVSLEDASVAASGNLRASGPIAGALQDTSISASGGLRASGSAAVQLEDATAGASGNLRVSGSVAVQLEGATVVASGIAGDIAPPTPRAWAKALPVARADGIPAARAWAIPESRAATRRGSRAKSRVYSARVT